MLMQSLFYISDSLKFSLGTSKSTLAIKPPVDHIQNPNQHFFTCQPAVIHVLLCAAIQGQEYPDPCMAASSFVQCTVTGEIPLKYCSLCNFLNAVVKSTTQGERGIHGP